VIAIIAVLIALLTAGIMLLMGKGPELQTVNEIRQLEISVQNFKSKYGTLPPSRIKLCPNYSDYTAAAWMLIAALY